MKKFFTCFVALLAIAAAATGSARAQSNSEQLFYTLDGTQTGGSNAYNQSSVITQGDITWKVTGNTMENPWRIGGKNLNAIDRDVYCEGSLDETITKVSLVFGALNNGITVNSVTMIVASDVNFSDIIEQKNVTYAANSTVDVTPGAGFEWTNAYYMFTFNVSVNGSNNKYLRLNAIRFYYTSGSATPEPVTAEYKLDSIPTTWQVRVNGVAQTVTAYTGGNTHKGYIGNIPENDSVTLIPDNPRRVKSVTLEDAEVPVIINIEGVNLDITGCTTWSDIIARNPGVIWVEANVVVGNKGFLVTTSNSNLVLPSSTYTPPSTNYRWQ